MIVEMEKVQIAIPASKREAALRFLQEAEVVHITEMLVDTSKNVFSPESQTAYHLAELQFVLDFMNRIRKELVIQNKKSWRNLFSGKPIATLADLEQTLQSLRVDELIKEIRALNDTLVTLESDMVGLQEQIKALQPWKKLRLRGKDFSLAYPIKHLLLTLHVRDEKAMRQFIANIPTAAWQEVGRYANKNAVIIHGEIVYHEKDQLLLDEFLHATESYVFTPELEDHEPLAQKTKSLQQQLQKKKEAYKSAIKQAKTILPKEQDVQFAYDALLHVREREMAGQRMVHTSYTTVFSGWMPRELVQEITNDMEARFPAATIEVVEPEEGEKPPVTFKNKPAIQPFEAVTNIYGKPAYNELDPSAFLALFFLVSFGLALSDAGYGLLMMGGMRAAEKFFRLKRELRKMVRLLFYAGFSTFIIGALTGGWFGITLEALPEGPVKSIFLSARLIDPISNPLGLLVVALVIGVIQLLFAWMVRGYHNYKTGNAKNIMLDDAPWITMVLFIIAWAAAKQEAAFTNLATPLLWLVYLNAAYLIFSQGRSYKNPLLKLGIGAISLYGLISFVSDTLSYSRLLALGLATGIIGLVVNLIASMVNQNIPVVGLALAGVVLLAGHTFNLGINVLGAFIHSGRLQFVEFFPKFMEGGGTPFKPLGRVSKYVDNPNEFK